MKRRERVAQDKKCTGIGISLLPEDVAYMESRFPELSWAEAMRSVIHESRLWQRHLALESGVSEAYPNLGGDRA